MKHRRVIFVSGALFAVLFAFLFSNAYQSEGPRVRIESALFSVDIVDEGEDLERGLGGRVSICKTCGMLFLFDHADQYAFWMKDMRFPLDILWIRNGKIVHIEQNVDFHDQRRVYRPHQLADRVLEVNAGSCQIWNIREGDSMSFEEL